MPYISERKVLDLIGSIYESAIDPTEDSLRANLIDLVELVSAGASSLNINALGSRSFTTVANNYLDESAAKDYEEKYAAISPFRKSFERLKQGEILNRRDVLIDVDYLASDIYLGFLKKYDIFNFEYHCVFNDTALKGGIFLSRPYLSPDFSASQRKVIDTVVPHFGRAFRSYLIGERIKAESSILDQVLDHLPRSIFVLDRELNVVYSNASAQRTLKENDGLSLDPTGHLRADHSEDTLKMAALVKSVFSPCGDDDEMFPGVMRVHRSAEKRPLEVMITPLDGSKIGSSPLKLYALAVVIDQKLEFHASEPLLVQMYGLTAAEATLCVKIAELKTIQEICVELCITENTARTHLKRIFSKTDTCRQSELVKLMLDGPARLAAQINR